MISFAPLQDIEAVISILAKIAIFGGVPEAKQQGVFRLLECGIAKKGESVFQRGDEPSHIYIVKSGNIELLMPDKELLIEKKKLGVGECFGQVALMGMLKHSVTAVATEDSEIIVLSRRALLQLRREDIELFALLILNIARELARRLTFTDNLLLRYLHKSEAEF